VGTVAACAATAVAGCTTSGSDGPARRQRPRPSAAADPDVALARRALSQERALLQQVDATVRAHPHLATVLAPTRAVHHAHVKLLQRAVPDRATASSSASGTPTASGAPTATSGAPTATSGVPTASASGSAHGPRPVPHQVPPAAGQALAALARQETRLARFGRDSALAARSGAFARVLASAAAAAGQQVTELTAAAGRHG
jgi:hypothetical protein